MIGVLVIVGILIMVPDHHQSVGYVFGKTINATGFGGGTTSGIVFFYVFLTGLLMAQYTITGYDASAHMSEETRSASIGAAWGMVMSVVVSVIFGFILLVAVTFAIPSTNGAITNIGNIITVHLGDVDVQTLGGVPAVHRGCRPGLLHDRVDNLGLADDVRVLARPRGARAPAVEPGLEGRPDPDLHGLGDRRARRS